MKRNYYYFTVFFISIVVTNLILAVLWGDPIILRDIGVIALIGIVVSYFGMKLMVKYIPENEEETVNN